METTTVHITGMTCGHCAATVRGALEALPGVQDVEVSADAGTATFTSASAVDQEAVEAAVREAGYTVVDPGAADAVDNLLI